MNGWNGCDEVAVGDDFEEIEIIFAGGPRSERNESRLERETGVITKIERAEEVVAAVAFFQFEQDLIVE